ncbi:MAG: hypothetical protein K8J09_05325 [Planctomycetes bacterium]|nr:hypothetical protein [Planctomycetota bacterium]
MQSTRSLLAVVATAAALTAQNYTTTIIHINTPGHPTNVVPGVGVPFRIATGASTIFRRPTISSDGQHLAFVAETNQATTANEVLLLDGALVMQEGQPTPWDGAYNLGGTWDDEFGLNDAGSILWAGDTSLATTTDEQVALFQGGVWTLIAQEGTNLNFGSFIPPTLTGLDPLLTGWGTGMDAPRITNGGQLLWHVSAMKSLTTGTANDNLCVLGNGTVLQEGVDVPAGQAGGGTLAFELFDAQDLYASPDGSVVLVSGNLTGTTNDNVLVVNGVVVVQEGIVLPGSSFATGVNLIEKGWVDQAGNWYARGSVLTSADDWLVRNGVLLAKSDATTEIVPGSGEHYDDATYAACFFAFDGNHLGQYVIGGVTDNADALRNGVIVFYDGLGQSQVVVRESDPIDLDGNGVFDNDRFFNTFGNDDVLLLNDGSVIFTATVKNGAGTVVEHGLFRRYPHDASCVARNGSNINPVGCGCVTLPITNTTWNLTVTNGPNTLASLLLADVSPLPPVPVFGGELLIGPAPIAIGTAIPVPPSAAGLQFYLQGLRVDFDGVNWQFVLTNAVDATIGSY